MLRPNKLHKMQYYYPPKIPEYTNDAITFFYPPDKNYRAQRSPITGGFALYVPFF